MNTIGSGREIFIVDDNDIDIEIAKRSFEKCQFLNKWRAFNSGEEFLQYLAKFKLGEFQMPEVVLIDINMPMMTGFEVIKATKNMPDFQDVPTFLMLTNSDSPEDRVMAKTVGAKGYIVKPSSIHEYIDIFMMLGK